MFTNTKYAIWAIVNNWWARFKPECKHWFKVVSSAPNGRKEIEVSKCRWCDSLTSELYIKGEKYDEHFDRIRGYGPVEACPITDDPPPGRALNDAKVLTLPSRELYFERDIDVVEVNRDSGTSEKAPSTS